MVFIWKKEDCKESRFGYKPGFDGEGETADGKGRWQRVEEKSAIEEACGGNIVKEEDTAAYKDIFCNGCSDHRDSLSLCFCSAELLKYEVSPAREV